jgi:hypothetical protein
MCRHNLGLEILAVVLVLAGGIAAFVFLPAPWFVSAPVAVLASYTVLETLLPKVWETPAKGIRYEPESDE